MRYAKILSLAFAFSSMNSFGKYTYYSTPATHHSSAVKSLAFSPSERVAIILWEDYFATTFDCVSREIVLEKCPRGIKTAFAFSGTKDHVYWGTRSGKILLSCGEGMDDFSSVHETGVAVLALAYDQKNRVLAVASSTSELVHRCQNDISPTIRSKLGRLEITRVNKPFTPFIFLQDANLGEDLSPEWIDEKPVVTAATLDPWSPMPVLGDESGAIYRVVVGKKGNLFFKKLWHHDTLKIPITALAFFNQSQSLAVGFSDGSIIIVDLEAEIPSVLERWVCSDDVAITSLAVKQDGSLILAGDRSGTVHLWEKRAGIAKYWPPFSWSPKPTFLY